MNGVLAINKAAGWTSFDVVLKLRRLLHEKRIGHAGTLDPNVTGVLLVLVGNATKACGVLPDESKTYEAVMTLGVETDTEDIWGTTLTEREVSVSEVEVRNAVLSFKGTYLQTPPMYSAKKVGGKKLYELARKNLTVERKAVPVEILSITVDAISLPDVSFTVSCSKGTYVRTLISDIGRKIGTGAAMKALKRVRQGGFAIADAKTVAEIEEAVKGGYFDAILRPTESLFSAYSLFTMKPECDRFLQNGNLLERTDFSDEPSDEALSDAQPYRIRFSDGRFGALYEYERETDRFRPLRMFL